MKTNIEVHTRAHDRLEVATATLPGCVLSLVARTAAATGYQQATLVYATDDNPPRTVTAATLEAAVGKLGGCSDTVRRCAGAALAALIAAAVTLEPEEVDHE